MPLDQFTRLRPALTVECVDGLAAGIDRAAERAAPSHRFLRYGWYAAALEAYGGAARTLSVARDGETLVALPIVRTGPAWLRMASVPGCYWPFRSFPAAEDAGIEAFEALLPRLAREAAVLRLGAGVRRRSGDGGAQGGGGRQGLGRGRPLRRRFLSARHGGAARRGELAAQFDAAQEPLPTRSISPPMALSTGASSRARRGARRHSRRWRRSRRRAGSRRAPTAATRSSPPPGTAASGARRRATRCSPQCCGRRCCASRGSRRPFRSI